MIPVESPELRATFHHGRHQSGLEVVLHRTPGFRESVAAFAIRFGAVDQAFEQGGDLGAPPRRRELPAGTAHFLEHQLFRGQGGGLASELSRLGARVFAHTELAQTCIGFSCVGDPAEALTRVASGLFGGRFDPSLTEEARVIREELRMHEDDGDERITRRVLRALYHRHPIREDVAGDAQSLERITLPVLRAAHEHFYRPGNATLWIASDIGPEEAVRVVDRALASAGTRWGPTRRQPTTLEDPRPVAPEERRIDAPCARIGRPKILMGFRDSDPPPPGRDSVRREAAMGIALRSVLGGSSESMRELMRRGWVDDSFHASYSWETGAGTTLVGGDTEHPEELEEVVSSHLDDARRSHVGEEPLRRARRLLEGRFFFAMDRPGPAIDTLVRLHGKGVHAWEFPAIVRSIGLEDVRESFRVAVAPGFRCVVVLRPQDGGFSREDLADAGLPGADAVPFRTLEPDERIVDGP